MGQGPTDLVQPLDLIIKVLVQKLVTIKSFEERNKRKSQYEIILIFNTNSLFYDFFLILSLYYQSL